MAMPVQGQLLVKFMNKSRAFGTWTDKTHVTPQYIEYLGQLINAKFAHYFTKTCDSRIIFLSPLGHAILLGIFTHATEFVNGEGFSIQAGAFLCVNDGGAGFDEDQQGRNEHEGEGQYQKEGTDQQVEDTLLDQPMLESIRKYQPTGADGVQLQGTDLAFKKEGYFGDANTLDAALEQFFHGKAVATVPYGDDDFLDVVGLCDFLQVEIAVQHAVGGDFGGMGFAGKIADDVQALAQMAIIFEVECFDLGGPTAGTEYQYPTFVATGVEPIQGDDALGGDDRGGQDQRKHQDVMIEEQLGEQIKNQRHHGNTQHDGKDDALQQTKQATFPVPGFIESGGRHAGYHYGGEDPSAGGGMVRFLVHVMMMAPVVGDEGHRDKKKERVSQNLEDRVAGNIMLE